MNSRRKRTRPPGLIPFDPVATLNDFAELLEELLYLAALRWEPDGPFLQVARVESWLIAKQHAKRLTVRFNRGFIEYLDINPRWMRDVNELYQHFASLRQEWQIRRDPPAWILELTERERLEKAEELQKHLSYYGDVFSVLRDVQSGEFTNDPQALELGRVLRLPGEWVDSASQAIARNWNLDERCKFHEETGESAGGWIGKCDSCGYWFSSRMICPHELGLVYRRCGYGETGTTNAMQSKRQLRLKVDADEAMIWLDETPYRVHVRSAMFVSALLNNDRHPLTPVSGRMIQEQFPDFPFNKVSEYKQKLPPAIRRLIQTNRFGSVLLPDAWINPQQPDATR